MLKTFLKSPFYMIIGVGILLLLSGLILSLLAYILKIPFLFFLAKCFFLGGLAFYVLPPLAGILYIFSQRIIKKLIKKEH